MNEFLLPAEVARRANERGDKLSPSGVRWAADHGELPFRRTLSGVRLFSERDVERFLKNRARKRSSAVKT